MAGTSDTVNDEKILTEFLTVPATTLYAQVAGDVYIPEPPATSIWDGRRQKGIVISRRGGGPKGERLSNAALQAKCYGGVSDSPVPTESQWDRAKDVARAFCNRIRNGHGTNVTSGRYLGGNIETSGQQITEPGTNPPWKYVLVFFTAKLGDKVA